MCFSMNASKIPCSWWKAIRAGLMFHERQHKDSECRAIIVHVEIDQMTTAVPEEINGKPALVKVGRTAAAAQPDPIVVRDVADSLFDELLQASEERGERGKPSM